MKQPKSVLLSWVEAIEKTGRELTDFEKHFVESVGNQLRTHGKISDKQAEVLEGIYASRTPLS